MISNDTLSKILETAEEIMRVRVLEHCSSDYTLGARNALDAVLWAVNNVIE